MNGSAFSLKLAGVGEISWAPGRQVAAAPTSPTTWRSMFFVRQRGENIGSA
jgi:hypothetical protein